MAARILIVSTPAGPVGSGVGGGLETTLVLLTRELVRRGSKVATLAPAGSRGLSGEVIQVEGECATSVTQVGRDHVQQVSAGGFLERAWVRAAQLQDDYDAVLNCSYDWVSFYAAAFFRIPVLHWVSVASLVDRIDDMMAERYREAPERFAFYSRAQAGSFRFVDAAAVRIIVGAVDLEGFGFVEKPDARLSWCARISPEKGLEDAIEAAAKAGMPLDVCGAIEDRSYWERCRLAGGDGITYHGFLAHEQLNEVVGRSQAMLFTPKWTEAFGMVALEAMACGTPVVAYRSGGPAEVIADGISGYLVEPGDIAGLARCARAASQLDRRRVRARGEEFGMAAQAGRIEEWVASV